MMPEAQSLVSDSGGPNAQISDESNISRAEGRMGGMTVSYSQAVNPS